MAIIRSWSKLNIHLEFGFNQIDNMNNENLAQ